MKTSQIIFVSQQYVTIQCLSCGNYHILDRDELGPNTIPQEKCSSPVCEVMLCSNCPQFECDGSGQHFCESHKVEYQHETLCPDCLHVAIEQSEQATAEAQEC